MAQYFQPGELKRLQHGSLQKKKKKKTDNICFADLYEQIEALERRVKVQGMHIQQVKLEADEEGMGDHSDLPMCQKIFAAEETA
jgi:hypothetical protein